MNALSINVLGQKYLFGFSLVSILFIFECTSVPGLVQVVDLFRENTVVPLPDKRDVRSVPHATQSLTLIGACGSLVLQASDEAITSDTGGCPVATKFRPTDVEKLHLAEALGSAPVRPVEFTILFEYASDIYTKEGRKLFREMEEDISHRQVAQIFVFGFTDTMGTDAYNLNLSQSRAAIVRSQIIQDVFPVLRSHGQKMEEDDVIAVGRGKLRDKICEGSHLTADQVPEPKNRCVEISVR